MLRPSTRVAVALGAALAAALTACSDSTAPTTPIAIAPRFSEVLKTWQCLADQGTSVTRTAPGTDGTDASATVAASDGEVVTRVAVKAGSDCWLTPAGASGSFTIDVAGSPCFVVEGLGTARVNVTRAGASPECKNITHVEYVSAPVPRTVLQLCIGNPYFLVQPVTFAVAGTTVTVGEANTYLPPLVCAEPIELPAGEHAITALPPYSGLLGSTAPDRLVSQDPATGTTVVLVVAGSTTIVTFHFGGDHND